MIRDIVDVLCSTEDGLTRPPAANGLEPSLPVQPWTALAPSGGAAPKGGAQAAAAAPAPSPANDPIDGELAAAVRLPIIIHCRASDNSTNAWDELLELLRDAWAGHGLGGVLHCFTGTPAHARSARLRLQGGSEP